MTGWWLPNPNAQRRTVVLFHDGATDTGCVHPYYRCPHAMELRGDATFTGLVFDAGGLLEVVGGPATRIVDP